MSLLTRKLVKLLAPSSITPRLLPNPALSLHQSSFYSTTSRNYIRKKPKPEPPSSSFPTLSPSSSSSPSPKLPSPPAWTSSDAVSHSKKDEVADEGGSNDHDWPRPSEIPWQATVANTVNLIGYVKMPVQIKASPDGKFWADTIISQEATSLCPLLWYVPSTLCVFNLFAKFSERETIKGLV